MLKRLIRPDKVEKRFSDFFRQGLMSLSSDRHLTLSDYLFPAATFDEAFLPPIRELSAKPASSSTTATHRFDPGVRLDCQRLPFLVTRVPNLHQTMYTHFQELLEGHPAVVQPISIDSSAAYRASRIAWRTRRLGDESSVSDLASSVAVPVLQVYKDLTGREIEPDSQIPADMRTVITDRAIREVPDNPDEEEGDIVILWEDKSIFDFARHAQALQDRLTLGSFSLVRTSQTTWGNEEEILAKVR
jgi:hypothetical protein